MTYRENAKESALKCAISVISALKLKKIVFSMPNDKKEIRTEGRLVRIKNDIYLQIEEFMSDGKALQKNLPLTEAEPVISEIIDSHQRMNIITLSGEGELMTSKKGKSTFIDNIKDGDEINPPEENNRRKNRILKEGTVYDFLVRLGVTDSEGKVFDRRRAKFRQIDRFLQYIEEFFPFLPESGEIFVLDLCCGKSYLTFAVYWYLTEIKHREVRMTGADRKEDVISFCSSVAMELGYKGLDFICTDITVFQPERHPNLVLSLHACDIATDIVLETASRLKADVILSTPCCQHQIFSQLKKETNEAVKPIMDYSLLGQKLAVALTDTLRCKRLQSEGYDVDVTELIDPEDTPKNLMIRARLNKKMSEKRKGQYKKEFDSLQNFFRTEIFCSQAKNTWQI